MIGINALQSRPMETKLRTFLEVSANKNNVHYLTAQYVNQASYPIIQLWNKIAGCLPLRMASCRPASHTEGAP